MWNFGIAVWVWSWFWPCDCGFVWVVEDVVVGWDRWLGPVGEGLREECVIAGYVREGCLGCLVLRVCCALVGGFGSRSVLRVVACWIVCEGLRFWGVRQSCLATGGGG